MKKLLIIGLFAVLFPSFAIADSEKRIGKNWGQS